MNKAEYFTVKRRLAFEKPLWVTLCVIAADLVLAYVAFRLLQAHTLPAFLASQILLTVFYFHHFALLHEAGHGNVHRKRWVNTAVGHYASVFCFMPYYPWKMIHQEHHVWTGNIDRDPTMANLRRMRERRSVSWIVRFAWRSWVPLAALLQHFVFWLYPLTMWNSRKMTRRAFLQSAFSVGWLVVAYIALCKAFPQWINLHNLWLSFVLYLIMTELVNLPHHVMVPTFHTTPARNRLHPWEQHITTRTCFYPYGLSLLTLNFNLHTEHHYFPTLPWYRLWSARSLLRPMLSGEYNEVIGINWNLENRSRSAADIVLPEVPHPLLLQPLPSP